MFDGVASAYSDPGHILSQSSEFNQTYFSFLIFSAMLVRLKETRTVLVHVCERLAYNRTSHQITELLVLLAKRRSLWGRALLQLYWTMNSRRTKRTNNSGHNRTQIIEESFTFISVSTATVVGLLLKPTIISTTTFSVMILQPGT